jgi:hypothetical protein
MHTKSECLNTNEVKLSHAVRMATIATVARAELTSPQEKQNLSVVLSRRMHIQEAVLFMLAIKEVKAFTVIRWCELHWHHFAEDVNSGETFIGGQVVMHIFAISSSIFNTKRVVVWSTPHGPSL